MNYLRAHWPALVLAVIVGACAAVPPLIAIERMGEAYQGIRPLVIDDQLYYLARAHETWDQHETLGSPYLYERKESPGVQFWVPDYLLALPGLWLGDLHAGVTLSQFAFPFLVVILSYAILVRLTKNRLLSFSISALLTPGLVFIPFLRTPNPQLFVLLLGAFLLLARSLPSRHTLGLIFSALLLGALFYIYPFYWTYWLVTLALAAVASFLLIADTRTALVLMLVLGGGVLLGVPYLLEWHAATVLPYYQESLARFGTIESRFPSGPFLIALSLFSAGMLALAAQLKLVPRDSVTALTFGAALAGAAVMNQQVVTGMNYFFSVHYATFIYFFSVFALARATPPLLSRVFGARFSQRALYAASALFLVFALASATPHVLRLAAPQESDVRAQRYAPALAWLAENAPRDAVVYANPHVSMYVPAYSSANVLWAPYAFLAYLPNKEAEERYIASHYLDGSFGREEIQATELDVFGLRNLAAYQHAGQLNKLRGILGMEPESLERYPSAEVSRIASTSATIRAGSFRDALADYRADYLVWDTSTDPDWRISRVSGKTERFRSEGVVIYELAP